MEWKMISDGSILVPILRTRHECRSIWTGTWLPKTKNRTGITEKRFLLFHKQFIEKFDAFRVSKQLFPVSGWDPVNPIPDALSHDHVLAAARHTNNPFAIDPHCKTPTWATVIGGSDVEPIYGYQSLCQFQSLDELGRAIDNGWHGTVHNTIGGDMSSFDSPIDPIFGGGTNGLITFVRRGQLVLFANSSSMKHCS